MCNALLSPLWEGLEAGSKVMFNFLIMLIWTTVIAHKQNSFIHYQLSGAGRLDIVLDNIFAVPQDRDAVVIDIQLDKDGQERFPDGTIYIHPATFQNSLNRSVDLLPYARVLSFQIDERNHEFFP